MATDFGNLFNEDRESVQNIDSDGFKVQCQVRQTPFLNILQSSSCNYNNNNTSSDRNDNTGVEQELKYYLVVLYFNKVIQYYEVDLEDMSFHFISDNELDENFASIGVRLSILKSDENKYSMFILGTSIGYIYSLTGEYADSKSQEDKKDSSEN